ncbi:MAG TPA: putative cytokinetic ring protein SteA [Actinomycetota bacterium]|nr:putative cytokinetic ring protein SteA [Actinomycetota bacterium]
MLFRSRSRTAPPAEGTIHGIARVDRRTKRLIGRLQPAEIAVIDHDDLDRIAAEGLVERKVKAVLNAAPSSTGKYPNLGPLVLTGAGIVLVDSIGPDLFAHVDEGDLVVIDEGRILVKDEIVAKGEVVTPQLAQEKLDSSKRDIGHALESFAENTLQYMVNEREFLLEAFHMPGVKTEISGRHVMVVVRGYGYKEDLLHLVNSGYLREVKPVLIAVDGGADALLDRNLKPDIIIGDMDSVTTEALTCGAELILHAYPDGRAPGKERLDALGLTYSSFEAPGTSEDIALLLAHEKGSELIVAVGARVSMVEFMDKGRKGMASTFLVRLRVGPKLVDAKGVSSLYKTGPSGPQLFGLVAAALVSMLIVVGLSPPLQLFFDSFVDTIQDLWLTIKGALG